MPAYEITIPNRGTYLVESKTELSNAQAYEAAKIQADADPTSGMATYEKVGAAGVQAFVNLGRGARQLASETTKAAPYAVPEFLRFLHRQAPITQAEIDESRKLEAPLLATTPGKIGNVAAAVPAMFVPGANTYTGAALIGGLMGMLQPTSGNESRALNTGSGIVAGGVGQGIGNAIGRVISPVRSALPPQQAALAAEAQRRGIPLTAGQATGSRPLQITESVMENLPFTSGPQLAIKQNQKAAFNRAVGSTFGQAEDAITPEVAGAARTEIGSRFTTLAGRNTLQADEQLLNGLVRMEEEARRNLTPDVGQLVLNRIDDVMARIENGQMAGTAYRNLDSEMGRQIRNTNNGDVKHAIGQIRNTLRDAMDRSISEADQAAWRQARREYGNLMTVAPIAARSEVGDISGRTLLNAATTANPNARFGGQSELATLGRIGRAFVADQIPNSGTAQRQFIQNMLTSGGGAVSGAIGGAGTAALTGNDPWKGAAIGAGALAGGLYMPRIMQGAMNSGLGQRYLTGGIMALTEQERAAINAAARAGLLGYAAQQ